MQIFTFSLCSLVILMWSKHLEYPCTFHKRIITLNLPPVAQPLHWCKQTLHETRASCMYIWPFPSGCMILLLVSCQSVWWHFEWELSQQMRGERQTYYRSQVGMGQNRAFFAECGANIAFRKHCSSVFVLLCTGWEEGIILCTSDFTLLYTGLKEGKKGVKNDVKRKSHVSDDDDECFCA